MVDIDLQVVAGILVGNPVALGDGVDVNDKPFLSEFPYLAAPDSGFDSDPSDRFEPPHAPVPPGGGPEPEGELRARSGRSAAWAALRPHSADAPHEPLKGRRSEI